MMKIGQISWLEASGNQDVKPEENGFEWWQQMIINSLLKPMNSGYTRRTDFLSCPAELAEPANPVPLLMAVRGSQMSLCSSESALQ